MGGSERADGSCGTIQQVAMTCWWWWEHWEGRWKPRIPGHVWTCHDGGRGNGHGHSHGGGRLSSLWFLVTNSLISQDFNKKKKQKRKHTRLETQMHLEPSLFVVCRPRWWWW